MSNSQSDLDWIALQYILDELEPEQKAVFEQQMADDQQAREALAGAVELVQTLSIAGRFPVRPASLHNSPATTRPRGRTALRWALATVTLAGCLAVFVLGNHLIQTDSNTSTPITSMDVPNGSNGVQDASSWPSHLAFAWIETANQWTTNENATNDSTANEWITPNESFSDSDFLGPDEAEESFTDSDDHSDDLAPAWMIAAVSGLAVSMSATDNNPETQVQETMEN